MKTRGVFSGNWFRVFATGIAVLALTGQFLAAQGWYDANWPGRAPITIDNSLATVLTDYQVRVTLGSTDPWSSTFTDGSDLRFTSDDGVTEIPYWIEDWNYGTSSTIWVKVPEIADSPTSTTIYMYYGASSVPTPDPVATPPAGPFTKSANNPGVINGAGAPAADADILPENIVYDPVTQHYWMVLSDQSSGSRVALIYSDNPTNPDAWYWSGYVINSAIAPHIIENNGTWYIFYGDRSGSSPYPISVASSSSVSGPYTKIAEVLQAGASGTWESYRVDEPYVFKRNDGKWILIYMAETGLTDEQVGYAEADDILGPYTKYAGNPLVPFGPSGAYDAGTVADPWVYEYDGVYYIGYTVSSTNHSPWQTALATTTDWLTITKLGVILPTGSEYNSFRGAVTRIGNQYVFPYTGGPAAGDYRLCIATQPVYQVPAVAEGGSDGDETFDFFDGFDGTILDWTNKWQLFNGSTGQASVSSGLLNLTVIPGAYIRIAGRTSFGTGYVSETYARHPDQGTNNLIAEFGFTSYDWSTLRIVDDFPNTTFWQRQAKLTGQTDNFILMAQNSDQDWHTFHIFRDPGGTSAGFQIDDETIETTSSNIPTMNLPPFLMSYSGGSTGSNNTVIVDWTRVRKWAGVEMTTTIEEIEFNGSQWTGAVDTDWHTEGNWIGGIPDVSSDVIIPDVTNQPIISAGAFCNSIIVETGASIELSGTNTLEIKGNWTNSGSFIAGSGTVLLSGSSQEIGGSSPTAFTNLTLTSTDTVTFGANVTIAGDLNISSGVVDPDSYTCDHTTPAAGTFTLADGAAIIIGGSGTLPQNFNTYSLASTSKVEYYGADQTVGAVVYGNLVLSGSGIKTITASITIAGNTTIKGTARALLDNGTTSTTSSLILSSVTASAGTWGSTSSTAGYRNDTYFSTAGTGILTVANSIPAGTWLGINSSSWSSTTNWAGAAVPGSGTNVVITDYALYKPLISGLSVPAQCNNLTLNTGAELTIDAGQALTVNGDLTNNGSITIESSWLNSNGSLIVSGSPSGTGTVSYVRFLREGNNTGDKHLLSSPVGGQPIPDFVQTYDAKIDSVRTWDEYSGTWQRVETGDYFTSGAGYNIYQADDSDGEFTFTGSYVNSASVPVTSPYAQPYSDRGSDPYGNDDPTTITWSDGRGYDIDHWVNWGGGGWNLLGNPFTSAMNAATFISTNSDGLDPYYQALFVYDGPNGYYKYVATTIPGYDDPENIQGGSYGSQIQAGQGFMVMANNDGVYFDFNSSMQVHNTVLPMLKSASVDDPWPGLKLKVKYGDKENMTTIVYGSEMTAGLDPGYDVGQLSTSPGVEIYTALVGKDEAVNLTRQALPLAGADTIAVPIGIDSYIGGEITFSASVIPLNNQKFWLEDKQTGVYTNLSTGSYTATLPENSFGTGRFYLLASTNTPTGIEKQTADDNGLRIWVSANKVIIKGEVSGNAFCRIYDIQGKRILDRRLSDGELNTIDIPAGLHGVFLVNVVDGLKVTTGKVAIL